MSLFRFPCIPFFPGSSSGFLNHFSFQGETTVSFFRLFATHYYIFMFVFFMLVFYLWLRREDIINEMRQLPVHTSPSAQHRIQSMIQQQQDQQTASAVAMTLVFSSSASATSAPTTVSASSAPPAPASPAAAASAAFEMPAPPAHLASVDMNFEAQLSQIKEKLNVRYRAITQDVESELLSAYQQMVNKLQRQLDEQKIFYETKLLQQHNEFTALSERHSKYVFIFIVFQTFIQSVFRPAHSCSLFVVQADKRFCFSSWSLRYCFSETRPRTWTRGIHQQTFVSKKE